VWLVDLVRRSAWRPGGEDLGDELGQLQFGQCPAGISTTSGSRRKNAGAIARGIRSSVPRTVASGMGEAIRDCRSDPRFAAQIAAGTGYVP
jgi:hypothetical protein